MYELLLTLHSFVVLRVFATRAFRNAHGERTWRIERVVETSTNLPYSVSLDELQELEDKILETLGDPDVDPTLISISHAYGLGFAFRVVEVIDVALEASSKYAIQYEDADRIGHWRTLKTLATLEEARDELFTLDASSVFALDKMNDFFSES